jgi:oligopeptidase B
VSKEKSKKYIVIGSGSTLTTEYRILNSDTPDGEFVVFNPEFVV